MQERMITNQTMQESVLQDAVYCINQALLQDNGALRVLTFAREEYRLTTTFAHQKFCYLSNNDYGLKDIAFPVFGKKNLVIDGKGAQLTCIGRVLPFYLQDCENITLKNFVIDYARPMFTQGRVVAIDDESVTLAIDKKEFPYYIVNGILYFTGEDYSESFIQCFLEFDPVTKRPLPDAKDVMAWTSLPAEEVKEGVVRIFFDFSEREREPIPAGILAANTNTLAPHRMRVGNTVIIKHERRFAPAIVIDRCKNVRLENIWVKHADTMGVLGQFSEDITLDHVKIATDPASVRVVSANADATHFVGCKGLITVENCFIESQLDDVINVHGNYMRITHVMGANRIVAQIPHRQQVGSCGIVAGGKIRLCDGKTMMPKGDFTVKAIHAINHKYYDITLCEDYDFAVAMPCCIEDIDGLASVVFRHNNCGRNRARGLLFTTGKDVLVEDNMLDCEGAVLKVNCDMHNWYESGAMGKITVRGNEMRRQNMGTWGAAMIDIDPQMQEMPEGFYMHDEIIIENNTIYLNELPLLDGWSVRSIQVTGNEIHLNSKHPMTDANVAVLKQYEEAVFNNTYVIE
ncbi:MAG: glycosyl hydrolase family 28 protein [Faecalibacterium sp.]